jgi:exopolysaccharide biosynthesis polyprenyl glycosylphosphotransferase
VVKRVWSYYLLKFVIDVGILLGVGYGVLWWRFGSLSIPQVFYWFGGIFTAVFVLVSYLRRDYMSKIPRDALDSFFSSIRTFLFSYLVAVLGIVFVVPEHPSRLALGTYLLVALPAVALHRYFWNRFFSRKMLSKSHRVLIAGAGEVGRRVAEEMEKLFGEQILILGFLDDEKEEFAYPILGSLSAFKEVRRDLKPDSLFISISNIEEGKMLDLMARARGLGMPVKIISDVFDVVAQKVTGGSMEKWPVIDIQDTPVRRAQWLVKRGFDLVAGSIILLFLTPLFLLVAAAIKMESSGPVLFKQKRMKNRHDTFGCFKFRTMYEDAEERKRELMDQNEKDGPIFKIKDDPRITKVGKWLRRFSIDEMPQIFNVLKGEMSLIGPRPPTPTEVEDYHSWQKRRLDGYAGMTGLWQVSGRSNLEFDDMCLLDIYYLENWSLGLDIKILLKTVPAVVFGKGAY